MPITAQWLDGASVLPQTGGPAWAAGGYIVRVVVAPPGVVPAGGGRSPGSRRRSPEHLGWNRHRALLQRNRDRELTAQIRDLYRALASDPSTAARAEAIVAAVVPPLPANRASATAREAELTAQVDALRRRADALEQDAVQAEIALRLLYREMRERQEAEDFEAVRVLLAEVL